MAESVGKLSVRWTQRRSFEPAVAFEGEDVYAPNLRRRLREPCRQPGSTDEDLIAVHEDGPAEANEG